MSLQLGVSHDVLQANGALVVVPNTRCIEEVPPPLPEDESENLEVGQVEAEHFRRFLSELYKVQTVARNVYVVPPHVRLHLRAPLNLEQLLALERAGNGVQGRRRVVPDLLRLDLYLVLLVLKRVVVLQLIGLAHERVERLQLIQNGLQQKLGVVGERFLAPLQPVAASSLYQGGEVADVLRHRLQQRAVVGHTRLDRNRLPHDALPLEQRTPDVPDELKGQVALRLLQNGIV